MTEREAPEAARRANEVPWRTVLAVGFAGAAVAIAVLALVASLIVAWDLWPFATLVDGGR